MSIFELTEPTTAKLADTEVLTDKNREPDTNPGAALDFTITTGNQVLTMLAGKLRGMLFEKNASTQVPAQGTLEGVPAVSDLPDLTEIGQHLGQFGWDLELTGYTLTCDQGLGGPKSNIELTDCKVCVKSVLPKQGGSVVLKLRVEAPNVPEKTHGKLALLKTREFPITLTPPEVDQQDIEDQDEAGEEVGTPPTTKGRRGGATLTPIQALKKAEKDAANGDGQAAA